MIVGIRFEGSRKIYYYLTSKKYYVGQKIKINAPSGGTPDATVMEINCKGSYPHIKELKEA